VRKKLPKAVLIARQRPKDQLRGWERYPYILDWWKFQDKEPDFVGVYCVWYRTRLLYIGCSKHVLKRIRQHNINFFIWYPSHVTVARSRSIEEAAELEAELILLHRPVRNTRREPKGGQIRLGRRAVGRS
jgi:predicted GIY-YIG superfamily endonuclease